ncbi:hypothetical protein POTOM_019480 [Populus tomentosa]|uniref:Uncharacterized protein n=1 Tax=Populus tomentosa TaxID=118781 RepID=A0A8X7ZS11_POPTO|nr:hypothetical protein POTOM_019480 [Populus tomentosa]
MPADSNPYVSPAPVAPSSSKNKMEAVKDVLGKWGKKAAEATKKAEDLAGNMWQHYCGNWLLILRDINDVKTGPSFADAAVGRIAQGTKVLAEGGYEKIFRQTFETVPEEQLVKTFACYLSTSAGSQLWEYCICQQQNLHSAVTILCLTKLVSKLSGAIIRYANCACHFFGNII